MGELNHTPQADARRLERIGREPSPAPSNGVVVSLNDREISAATIESCRRGDREAFGVLYEAYKNRVYSISLYFFHGDESAASEATQQVFLKLITGISQFRGDSGFATWLYRLVVNTCLDGARQAKSRAQVSDPSFLDARRTEITGRGSRSQPDGSVGEGCRIGFAAEFRLAILMRYFDELS